MSKEIVVYVISALVVLSLFLICADVYEKVSFKQRILTAALCYFIYFSLMIFRPVSLSDTSAYYELYHLIDPAETFTFSLGREKTTDFEYLFVYLIQFTKRICNNFTVFNLFITLMIIVQLAYGTKLLIQYYEGEVRQFNHPLFLFLFLSYYGLYYNAVVLRAGLAIAFTYLAFALFVVKKSYFKALLLEVAGFLFQRMGVLGWTLLPAYSFICFVRSKKAYIVWWWCLAAIWCVEYKTIFFLDFFKLLINKISNLIPGLADYANYLSYHSQAGILFVLLQLTFLLNGLYYLISIDYKNKKLVKIVNLYFYGLSCMVLGMRFKFISRIVDFYLLFSILLNYYSYTYNTQKLRLQKYYILPLAFMYTICVLRAITY